MIYRDSFAYSHFILVSEPYGLDLGPSWAEEKFLARACPAIHLFAVLCVGATPDRSIRPIQFADFDFADLHVVAHVVERTCCF